MRWPWNKQTEQRDAAYADAVIATIIRNAGGTVTAEPSQGGPLEVAAGVVGRAFASCAVTPALPALTPSMLALVGRELIRRGECVFAIDTRNGLRLIPAATWDITGGHDPAEWTYRLDLAGPSGQFSRTVSAEGLLHFRYACDPQRPWEGLGPLQVAIAGGELQANVERMLADEGAGARGNLLPVPEDGESQTVDTLKADIAKLAGRTALVETTSAGWGEGGRAAPQADWQPKRLGADPPEALVTLHRDASALVLSACGVPPELVASGDGVATREAWRRFLFSTIRPLGELVQQELAAKLERPITLGWTDLRAIDVESRARAYAQLRKGGMDDGPARELAGLA